MIPVRGFEGKRVAVFGLGRTGLTAARALIAGGAEVALWDEKAEARDAAIARRLCRSMDLQAADWPQFSALMLSPGVPLTHPKPHWTVDKAKAAGVEILGDIELFARTVNAAPAHKRPKVVAITGTNGKSTTTALIGHICRAAGKDARIGGNIGLGVLGLEDMHGGAIYVLELSSYQLDLTSSLKADAAVLLNISPDHLERHGDMDGYVAAKRRVLLNQGKGDTAVIGVDDPWCQRICTEITAANRRTICPISSGRAIGRGVYALQGVLYDGSGERAVEVCDLLRARALPGRHNWQNAAAAYAACRALGIPPADVADAILSFPGLAHRMELVGKIGGVRFVNDSKATNADAARQAMSTYPAFFWIAGGVAKAGGIEPPRRPVPARPRPTWSARRRPVRPHPGRQRARRDQRRPGDRHGPGLCRRAAESRATGQEAVVLLSPACASFDQFADFEKRGDAFREIVQGLALPAAKGATG